MTNNNKYIYNETVFYAENAISYYLLGVFITDGNVSMQNKNSNKKHYSCELKSADYDWILQLSNICGINLPLTPANNSKCLRLRLHNTKIGEWLINHQCIPNKTLIVKFPLIPDNYIADFIRGCWDGDGFLCLSYRKNGYVEAKAQLNSASKDFIYEMQNTLLNKFNIKSSISNVKMQDHKMKNGTIISAKNQLYTISISGSYCQLFVNKIYYSNNPLSLKRKNHKADQITLYYNTKPTIRKTTKSRINWIPNKELIKLINKSNVTNVAKLLKINIKTLLNRLKKQNIDNLVIKRQKVILPDNDILLKMLEEKTYIEIAKELNITTTTLRKKMKQSGLP